MPRPRVVIADDYVEARALVARVLKAEFDVVAAVADGQAAVDACSSLHPDVVVLDISMPVLNGFLAADIIRRLPDAPRILFLTAHDDADFARPHAGQPCIRIQPKSAIARFESRAKRFW